MIASVLAALLALFSFVDDRAPAAERLKGLVVYHTSKNHCRTRLWVSTDGIHWKLKEGVEWQKIGPDPGTPTGIGIGDRDSRGSGWSWRSGLPGSLMEWIGRYLPRTEPI